MGRSRAELRRPSSHKNIFHTSQLGDSTHDKQGRVNQILIDMKKNPLSLWFAYPEDPLAGSVTGARAQLLSEDERKCWQSFRFDGHRQEYLTTRALVRCALSHHHPLSPEAWRFQLNARGKPAIYPD